jgi:hypothetical protein
MIEDTGNETPEEGDSTEETESRDGDRVPMKKYFLLPQKSSYPPHPINKLLLMV